MPVSKCPCCGTIPEKVFGEWFPHPPGQPRQPAALADAVAKTVSKALLPNRPES